jgi:hypothetical protein
VPVFMFASVTNWKVGVSLTAMATPLPEVVIPGGTGS